MSAAERRAIKPSGLLLTLLGGLFATAVPLGILPALEFAVPSVLNALWWTLLLALFLFAGLDALWLQRQPSPRLTRQLPNNLPQGRWNKVRLSMTNTGRRALRLGIFDHLPVGMDSDSLPLAIELPLGTAIECNYRIRAQVRGHFHFQCCEIALPSPLGLWQGRRYLALPGDTRVYPDFGRLHGAQLQAVDAWLGRLGVRQQPRRGLGLEFHQLREFHDGDSLRQIDWKATARQHRPIVREYQDERDQQILFLLDCGRRMHSQDGERSHFDHALNACLLLTYVALRQGDAVGMATFASEQPRFLAPLKGSEQLNRLLNTVYDLQSTRLPADYAAAASLVLARQHRRALIVLVSNLRDEDDAELLNSVRRLSHHHRVLVASLREEVLDRLTQTPVRGYADALAYCGTRDYLDARDKLHERLIAQGIPLLDARPGELGPELISHYLAWKRAGTL